MSASSIQASPNTTFAGLINALSPQRQSTLLAQAASLTTVPVAQAAKQIPALPTPGVASSPFSTSAETGANTQLTLSLDLAWMANQNLLNLIDGTMASNALANYMAAINRTLLAESGATTAVGTNTMPANVPSAAELNLAALLLASMTSVVALNSTQAPFIFPQQSALTPPFAASLTASSTSLVASTAASILLEDLLAQEASAMQASPVGTLNTTPAPVAMHVVSTPASQTAAPTIPTPAVATVPTTTPAEVATPLPAAPAVAISTTPSDDDLMVAMLQQQAAQTATMADFSQYAMNYPAYGYFAPSLYLGERAVVTPVSRARDINTRSSHGVAAIAMVKSIEPVQGEVARSPRR